MSSSTPSADSAQKLCLAPLLLFKKRFLNIMKENPNVKFSRDTMDWLEAPYVTSKDKEMVEYLKWWRPPRSSFQ